MIGIRKGRLRPTSRRFDKITWLCSRHIVELCFHEHLIATSPAYHRPCEPSEKPARLA